MRLYLAAASLLLCLSATPALAEDKTPCASGMVCASAPETVVAGLIKAGLTAKLSKDNDGDPMIEVSAGATYTFDVFFYGCVKGANCDSIRFEAAFEKAPENTAELANKWNKKKRFFQAFVRDDGGLAFADDVPTIGGLNQKNFADVVDWWTNQLGELATFFKQEVPAAK